MNTYHHLFSPIKVGHTTIKNRVFMPPISTNLADKGYITDELIQHYEVTMIPLSPGGRSLQMQCISMVPRSFHSCFTLPIWHSLFQAHHV